MKYNVEVNSDSSSVYKHRNKELDTKCSYSMKPKDEHISLFKYSLELSHLVICNLNTDFF